MLVKEEGKNEYEALDFLGIAGFDYSKGYEYTLLVKKTTLLNPPADASNIAYELVEVLSKVGVEYEYTIEVDGPILLFFLLMEENMRFLLHAKKKICSRRVY